ncbi:hypothetical protein OROMI_029846 [Orobanche minor]
MGHIFYLFDAIDGIGNHHHLLLKKSTMVHMKNECNFSVFTKKVNSQSGPMNNFGENNTKSNNTDQCSPLGHLSRKWKRAAATCNLDEHGRTTLFGKQQDEGPIREAVGEAVMETEDEFEDARTPILHGYITNIVGYVSGDLPMLE